MPLVPRRRTTPTPAEWLAAIRAAWDVLEPGFPASNKSIACLWGHFALETGRGRSCWNNNLGNVRRGTWLGDTFDLPGADEEIDGKRVVVGGEFRSFATLDEGARAYIEFLCERYPRAWSAVRAGDATAFVRELHDGHYFTAPLDEYGALISIARGFDREFATEIAQTAPTDPAPEAPPNTQPSPALADYVRPQANRAGTIHADPPDNPPPRGGWSENT